MKFDTEDPSLVSSCNSTFPEVVVGGGGGWWVGGSVITRFKAKSVQLDWTSQLELSGAKKTEHFIGKFHYFFKPFFIETTHC